MSISTDRRAFLRSTAAAGAGLAISPFALGRGGGDREQINVALIGAGNQGEVLMRACVKMGADSGIRFKAVCDIWENLTLKRVAGLLKRFRHEPTGYVDHEDMLANEKDLDAVLIATPDFWHAEHTVACLKAGLHVYCEAPMSNTIEGARSMARAARQTDKLLQIGHQRRSNPRYIHCRDKLVEAAGILGRLTAADAQWNSPARADRGWSKRRVIEPVILEKYGYRSMHQFKNWMWYKGLGAGPVVDYGAHQIDVLNWFLGAHPKSITARGGTYYHDRKTHEWCDTVMAILEYETTDGPVSACHRTITTNGYRGHVEVFMGDEGTLELSESPGSGGVYRDPQAPDWDKWVRLDLLGGQTMTQQKPDDEGVIQVQQTQPPVSYDIPVKFDKPNHQPHLQNFFEAIRGGAALNCPAETAYATTVAALRINEAIAANGTVDFTPEEFRI